MEFRIVTTYKINNGNTDRTISYMEETNEFITPCEFFPDIMMGGGECATCKFIDHINYDGGVVNLNHIPGEGITDKNVITRAGEVVCRYSKDENKIKSIW